jgi:hypothetical protein
MTANLKTHRDRRDTVSVETHTRTTHYVNVDLAALLGQFDVTDEVVLLLDTPSGRAKRVAVGGNFLAPRRNDEGWAV